MTPPTYSTLFLDIGGVILTNGWDHQLREKAAQKFQIDYVEMNKRHALIFDTYEIGKITLDDYLNRVIFNKPREFSLKEFKDFMLSQPYSYPDMIELIHKLKKRYALKIIAVTNEGRELMEERIKKFKLNELIDFFICSGFVGLRKPDIDIYRMAFDVSYTHPSNVIYIDDRPMLIEIGQTLGMQCIQHSTFEQTKECLKNYLSIDEKG